MYLPAEVDTVIEMLASAHPDQLASTWDVWRSVMADGCGALIGAWHSLAR